MTSTNQATSSESEFRAITVADVQGLTDSGSYSRGRSYYNQGRIHDTRLRERTIEALCRGSGMEPYRVSATFPLRTEPLSRLQTACSCPIGTACKHVVALLLSWIDNRDSFVTVAPLAEQLERYDKDELIALMVRMVQRAPELEHMLTLMSPRADAGSWQVERTAIRRTAQASLVAFTHQEPRWGHSLKAPRELNDLIDLAQQHLDAGRLSSAFTIYEVIAEEAGDNLFEMHDEDFTLITILRRCDDGLAAILDSETSVPESQRLTRDERQALIEAGYALWRLNVFEAGGQDFGGAALEAIARHATADERSLVESWLDGEKAGDWSGRMLVEARVMMRAESGVSRAELLTLYRDAGLWDQVATVLIEDDRIDEAISTISRNVPAIGTFLGLAGKLIAHDPGLLDRAVSMVEDRAWEVEKQVPWHDANYQRWISDTMARHGSPDRAIPLIEREFRWAPALDTWLRLRQVATDPSLPAGTWDDLRSDLVAFMVSRSDWWVLTEIHLSEGEVGAAVQAWDRAKAGKGRAPWTSAQIESTLAKAAEQEFPDRSIAIYRKQADHQIAMRNRSAYAVAAELLANVRRILIDAGRADEWQTLITDIRTTNKQLRALRDELDQLGLA